ncbi:MAG: EamA family transporter RarD [Desulfobulbaceae bacterium]|jgi:chloramphenicol-sensitive protein RarD|nr:EamA family transporter RarD [Desulfobulbaceae bacterium]
MSAGIFSALAAYLMWGFLPIYWKSVQAAPATEILCHRICWSLVICLLLLAPLRQTREALTVMRDRRRLALYIATSLLLTSNWLLYIWVVNAGYILEGSLAYFINPLISVCFGVIFFRERLRPVQVAALVLVVVGIVYLTVFYGQFPWIALLLATSFGVYGLLHKKATEPVLTGALIETIVVFPPALIALIWLFARGQGEFVYAGWRTSLLLAGAGLVTLLPLLLFNFATQRIPLSLVGLLQYLSPTINLLIGLFVYHEQFPRDRMLGFSLIWLALLLYLAESGLRRLRQKAAALNRSRHPS